MFNVIWVSFLLLKWRQRDGERGKSEYICLVLWLCKHSSPQPWQNLKENVEKPLKKNWEFFSTLAKRWKLRIKVEMEGNSSISCLSLDWEFYPHLDLVLCLCLAGEGDLDLLRFGHSPCPRHPEEDQTLADQVKHLLQGQKGLAREYSEPHSLPGLQIKGHAVSWIISGEKTIRFMIEKKRIRKKK